MSNFQGTIGAKGSEKKTKLSRNALMLELRSGWQNHSHALAKTAMNVNL